MKLVRAEFPQPVAERLQIDVLSKLQCLEGKFEAKVVRMRFRLGRSKAIFQIKGPDDKTFCQSQCREEGDILSAMLRAKVCMWIALSGANKATVVAAKQLMDA